MDDVIGGMLPSSKVNEMMDGWMGGWKEKVEEMAMKNEAKREKHILQLLESKWTYL